MQNHKLYFEGKTIRVGDQEWNVDYPIQEGKLVNEKVVLIYDSVAIPDYVGQFRNLEAFDLNGCKLWTAEHPTNQAADLYVKFLKTDPLIVLNFASFICRIDPSNGKLMEAEFTK